MLPVRRLHRATFPLAIIAALLTPSSAWPQSPAQKADPDESVQKIRQMKEAAKKEREAAIQKLKAKIAPLMDFTIEELQLALTVKVATTYGGAKVVADDDNHTYLGEIDDEFSYDSIFNDYGTYGSEYSSDSIWNDYGQFGGEYSLYSPLNRYSTTPPLILKNGRVIGRLTINKYVAGAVDPNWLKSHFTY